MRVHARWTLLILVAFLLTLVPTADVAARSTTDDADARSLPHATPQQQIVDGPGPDPVAPPPEADIVLPTIPPIPPITVSDGRHSSLHVTIAVNPDPITVGETAVISLTVANNSPFAAEDVQLQLPMPAGAGLTPLANRALQSPRDGWRWTFGRIDGNSGVVVTAELLVAALPPGEALVLRPTVIDRDLTAPVAFVGGALVMPVALDLVEAITTVLYDPARATTVRSKDDRVALTLPERIANEPLRIQYSRQSTNGVMPSPIVGLSRGLTPFFLTASNLGGQETRQFRDPLTIAVRYTPEQLLARGIAEGDLQLYWYNDRLPRDQQHWVPIKTTIDSTNNIATANVDHFTPFALSDGAKPSEAFIPSVKAWQVSLFTGSATYEQTLDVPAGAAGLKPGLQLTYNSASTDGLTGMRREHQAGWVGKGWNLDTGAVSRNKILREEDFFKNNTNAVQPLDTFSLVFNGQAIDVVRGERTTVPTSGTYEENAAHLDLYKWRSTDETFVRIEAFKEGQGSWNYSGGASQGITYEHNGAALNEYGRGGKDERFSAQDRPRYSWRVWTKDGTKYEFREDLWYGWHINPNSSSCENIFEQYKWLLSSVTDTHGNTINYAYNRRSWVGQGTCPNNVFRGTVDVDAWPVSITWGSGDDPAAHRYRVRFFSSPRSFDNEFKAADVQYTNGNNSGIVRETRQLDEVVVESKAGASWQNVRSYLFKYAAQQDSMTSDWTKNSAGEEDEATRKITLTEFQMVGNDRGYNYAGDGSLIRNPDGSPTTPGTGLPIMKFTYGRVRGTTSALGPWPYGDWNRLKLVDNGQGGKVGFEYTEIEPTLYADPVHQNRQYRFGEFDMGNYRRVTFRNVWDGLNDPTTLISTTADFKSRYIYENPQLNSMGTKGGEGKATQEEPNSAILYYNSLHDGDTQTDDDDQKFLMHRQHSEFRGHAVVTEVNPTGAKIRNTFYQGDIENCPQSTTDPNLEQNACFVQLKSQEFRKGKPRRTEWFTSEASTTPLRWVEHTYDVTVFPDIGTPEAKKSGQWRGWSRETETVETTLEGGSTEQRKTTTTAYESTYGNPIQVEEFINADRQRITQYQYTSLSDAVQYIVDRPSSKVIFDGVFKSQALSYYFYDGRTTSVGIGDATTGQYGNLTLERVYYNVPNVTGCLIGTPLYSTDTSYTYDTHGNQTAVTTYDGPGRLLRTGSSCTSFTNTWSAPGNGTPPSITTTDYDTLFNTFPLTYTQRTGAGVTLIHVAGWDRHMATLKQVKDPNGNATNAWYDVFGRMTKLWKPGDNINYPTSEFVYEDNSQPFVYRIKRREVANSDTLTQPTYVFYDGLGRQIQTKQEMINGARMKVTDTVYDGLDRPIAQSTPRYVDASGTGFTAYTVPPALSCPSGAWTCTSYDALGRRYDVTAPDGALTQYRYGVDSSGLTTTTTDPNNHRTVHTADTFDRLQKVVEYSGTGATGDPHTSYATTQYAYNALDLLTNVTDAANNQTTITYDSAGRKNTMRDPDMGLWAYTYDVAGNLVAQTDAKNQTTLFGYDDLNRMTSKLAATYQPFSDAFATKDATEWIWSTHQTVVVTGTNSVIQSTGTGTTWDATFARDTYDRNNRHGVKLRFKLDAPNTEAQFMLEADDPDPETDVTHPRFGVYAHPSGRLRVQSSDGTNTAWQYADLLEPIKTGPTFDQWYVLMLLIDDNGGFTAHVYPDGQPDQAVSYRTTLPNARGKFWRFRHYIRTNKAYIDDFREYTGAYTAYDAGVNGKGHRTSMSSPGVSQSWNYDTRGRLTQAGYGMTDLSGGRNIQYSYDAADRITSMTYPSGEEVTYTYDPGWRQLRLCSVTYTVCYAEGAIFDALDQPFGWELGNGLHSRWNYYGNSRRLYELKLGTAGAGLDAGAHIWNRYAYDPGGNVTTIADFDSTAAVRETQSFGYDHRDRLTTVTASGITGGPAAYTTSFSYNAIGNLMSKAGFTYAYPASGPTSVRPHAVTCTNWTGSSCGAGASYSYDALGNLTSGGGGTYTWSGENQPLTITKNGVSEGYLYNADNERIKRSVGGVHTFFFANGLAEETGTVKRHAYTFNGQTIAERDVPASGASTFRYLHGDHLGSVAAVSTSNTTPTVTKQYFTVWGDARHGNLTSTTERNYTGQRKDDTGLLFYNARYYDPKLSRFISPDTIVPGMASGKGGMGSIGVDGNTRSMLTVDFHERQFATQVSIENQNTQYNGFWFEQSYWDQLFGPYQWGPPNPQSLDRYSYGLNNPLRYTDPTGHQCYDGVHRRGCYGSANGSGRGGSSSGAAKGKSSSYSGGGGGRSGGGRSGGGGGSGFGDDDDDNPDGYPIKGSNRDKQQQKRQNQNPQTSKEQGGWETRETNEGSKNVYRVAHDKVPDGLEEEKSRRGYAPTDQIYTDGMGNYYVGGTQGELESIP